MQKKYIKKKVFEVAHDTKMCCTEQPKAQIIYEMHHTDPK